MRCVVGEPGVDVNRMDEDGTTQLYVASWEDHAEVVAVLLRTPGFEVNRADRNGWTPLYVRGVRDVMRRGRGAAPGRAGDRRQPVLVGWGDAPLRGVRLRPPRGDQSLAEGAGDRIQPHGQARGHAPLLLCASPNGGHAEAAALLLEAPGVAVFRTDGAGRTALDVAENKDCVILLEEVVDIKRTFSTLLLVLASRGVDRADAADLAMLGFSSDHAKAMAKRMRDTWPPAPPLNEPRQAAGQAGQGGAAAPRCWACNQGMQSDLEESVLVAKTQDDIQSVLSTNEVMTLLSRLPLATNLLFVLLFLLGLVGIGCVGHRSHRCWNPSCTDYVNDHQKATPRGI